MTFSQYCIKHESVRYKFERGDYHFPPIISAQGNNIQDVERRGLTGKELVCFTCSGLKTTCPEYKSVWQDALEVRLEKSVRRRVLAVHGLLGKRLVKSALDFMELDILHIKKKCRELNLDENHYLKMYYQEVVNDCER